MTNICILGEAWGENEERERTPFVGPSGYELTRMLDEAGIARADCFLTNVFNLRPSGNRIEALCGPKTSAIKGYPALTAGKFIQARYEAELTRLGDELCSCNPNLVLTLGNIAAWALLGRAAISKIRGTTDLSTHTVAGFKVLPTYHPAAVLRQWDLRPIVVVDFMKAAREQGYTEIRRPKRTIWIEPTLDDLLEFNVRHLEGASCLSVDIETAGNQITCIGFAPDKSVALVIPFVDTRKSNRSYWKDDTAERQAWSFVRETLQSTTPKLFQNGLYDLAFLWRSVGIAVRNAIHDTMLLHHALQPESLKSLGFMGSIYCDEGAWKQMRTDTIKRDA